MDKGHKYADKVLAEITNNMMKVFDSVDKKAIAKVKRYLKSFEQEIEKHERMVDDGEMSQRDFERWMINTTTTGSKWKSVRNEVADDYHEATVKAMATAGAGLMLIYNFNRKYANESIREQVKKYYDKTLSFSKSKPRRKRAILPKSPDPKKNRPWHRKKVESVIRKGMKKGESVDKIARNLHEVTKMDRVSAYRAARTGVTCAENEARIDAMIEAQELGIMYDKVWVATLDSRTRTSHRLINGERVPCEEYFSNGLFEPADPDGDPAETYNCRCTVFWSPSGEKMEVAEAPSGKSREEWAEEKPISKPYPRWRDE